MRTALLCAAVLLASYAPEQHAAAYCRSVRVTGYVRSEFSPWTYDGTPISTDEPIAAASWDIPLGAHVVIEGLGRFRVADRGHLGSDGWVDVAVHSRSEAYALTGRYHACIVGPDDPDPFDVSLNAEQGGA
jgi:3D (Asp-Asp-Asp) domain-containing protein